MDQRVKIGLGVGAGCMIVCVLAAVAGFGGLIYSVRDPENIAVTISVPDSVAVNDSFNIELTIQNTAGTPQTLEEIDLTRPYMNGVFISSADPAFYESILGDVSDLYRYKFGIDIPANGSLIVVLDASARQAGEHIGELEVCVGSIARCLNYTIRTVVTQ